MKEYEIDMYGNAGIYLADGNTFTFQLGEGDSPFQHVLCCFLYRK